MTPDSGESHASATKRGGRGALWFASMVALEVLVAVVVLACSDDATSTGDSPVVVPPVVNEAPKIQPSRTRVRFTRLEGNVTGFAPINHTGTVADKQWIAEAMGGGVIAIDYNNDGLMDLFTVDGNLLDAEPTPEARSRMFRNDGGFKFTEVTREVGIDITGFGNGGAAADYDGDGFADLYVCLLGRNYLYRNRGNGTFEDVTVATGVGGPEADMSTAASFGDFDGDGRLDLYVSNYIDMHATIRDMKALNRIGRSCEWRGFKVYCGPQTLPFQNDRLFLQTKKGVFEDASARLKDQIARPGFQSVAVDFDQDGDLDIYVANDTTENTLWMNDGKGNFVDEGLIRGCAVNFNVVPQAGMGVDAADYDGDGLIDIIVTNFSHDHFTLYRNRPVVRRDGSRSLSFEDVSVPTGVSQATYLPLGWGAHFTDVDNDSDADLFFANGHVYVEIDNFPATQTTYRQKNQILLSSGGKDPKFALPEEGLDAVGLGHEGAHRASLAVDLDNDGDEDFVVSQLNGPAYILRNDTEGAGQWVRLSLRRADGTDAAGATVRVFADGIEARARPALRGISFLCGADPRLLFGLGTAKKVSRVEVLWPGGQLETYRDLDAGGHWLITEGAAGAKRLP
jgi:hypothetical protein